jgi:oligopeptide/dipeptide ABC transporter ATP-binding protein
MRDFRGSRVAMIPQDPLTSLNPVYKIGDQVGEPLTIHQQMTGAVLRDKVVEMLKLVHIPSPLRRVKEYPHQFSGGMKQRAMIAMSLSCNPNLVIADEPTTALDVTIQAQILQLLRELQSALTTSILFITHDLGVVAGMCARVAVMYAGTIVEQADVQTIFKRAKHPYTRGLIDSVPRMGQGQKRLFSIEGQPPNLLQLPRGCRFSPRCSYVKEPCLLEEPPTECIEFGHEVRCFRWREI